MTMPNNGQGGANASLNQRKQGMGSEIGSLIKGNVRDYAMYIALVVIFAIFTVATGGIFISSRNIMNLMNQTAYVAVMAVGMTLVLIIVQIDLSVGFVAGFTGAIAAILLQSGLSVWLVIPIVLVCGILVGAYQGFLITKIKVPAFVTTLAGMFIFRGLLSLITAGSGTIIVKDDIFTAMCNDNIPDLPGDRSFHLITLIIGILLACIMIFSQFRNRRNLVRYDFKVTSQSIFVVKLVVLTAIIMGITWIMASYKGIPWSAVIVAVVLMIYHFVLSKTKFGRSIYAIGGNREAAELSGVKVDRVMFITFMSMSMLAALGGMLYTSRLASATPNAGVGFELDAIASSYIGGVAVSGGVGKVTNTIIGALVIMSLTNGMNLLGVDISFQYVVKGAIFILAVAFDVTSRRKAK